MNKKPGTSKDAADKLVKNIRRKTRQTYSAEEKIRIVLAGLRGEESISALCRREGISDSLYYTWSKEFLEAGKRRLSGDTARQATSRGHAGAHRRRRGRATPGPLTTPSCEEGTADHARHREDGGHPSCARSSKGRCRWHPAPPAGARRRDRRSGAGPGSR